MPRETPLSGGWVTAGVVRVGETVRRPGGANAARVRLLLEHLENVGFDAAPCYLGLDDQGRMVLSFIEGDVPSDCRSIVWDDHQLEEAAGLLRRFHDATAGTQIAEGTEVVCHHDFGPWNLVWREGLPVAIIDFDNAGPGTRLDDLGYAVWKHLNLGLVELPADRQGERLRVMARAYGAAVDAGLVAAIARAQTRMREVIEGGSREILQQHAHEREWLRQNAGRLIA